MPDKLRNSMKSLINIKNNDNKCFLWCHIKHLNPLQTHHERIIKADKIIVNDLDYADVKFPVSKKIVITLKIKMIFVSMRFIMKMVKIACIYC